MRSFYHWGKSRALRILGKPCSLFNFISNINNNDDDDINNDNDNNDNIIIIEKSKLKELDNSTKIKELEQEEV